MKKNYPPLTLFCILDVFLPFFSFFVLLSYTPLQGNGWLIAPISILVLVAIVFVYILSEQFPAEGRKAWRLVGNLLISLAIMLVSSGMQWQTGLFQYGLLELIALAGTFGLVLPRQKSIIGWLFGLPALGWAIIAAWTSYQLYVETFFVTTPWLVWALWPIWLFAAVPLIRNRYGLINGFFLDYYKRTRT